MEENNDFQNTEFLEKEEIENQLDTIELNNWDIFKYLYMSLDN